MKKIASLLLAACLLLPASAHAAEYGVYVTPKLGLGIQSFKVGVQPDDLGDHVSGNKAVFGGAIAVGYDFNTRFDMPIRAELEYAYWAEASKSKNAVVNAYNLADVNIHGKGTVGIQSLFANVYYDFHNSTAFTPYVGAGIGMGFVKTKGALDVSASNFSIGGTAINNASLWASNSKTTTNFAWNIGLGCAYAFNDMVSIDLGYRYASFGSGKTDSGKISGQADSVSFPSLDTNYHFKSSRNDMHQFTLGLRLTF